jgi:hypothetical protein
MLYLLKDDNSYETFKAATCPICRDKMTRPPRQGKRAPPIVPLEIKLKVKSAKAKGKEKEVVEAR